MSNAETGLQNRILAALSAEGCLVFRNESAGAWVGRVIHREGDIVTLRGARMIKAGLAVGSSDIIGGAPVTITPEMVGKTVLVFLAPEVKTLASHEPQGSEDQKKFIAAIVKAGGIAGIVTSPDEAIALGADYIDALKK